MNENQKESDSTGERKFNLTIVTPVGKWQHPFDKDTTIEDVIKLTFGHFHEKLNPSDPYELRRKDSEVALDVTQTLAALGIHDGEILLLVKSTVGGGK